MRYSSLSFENCSYLISLQKGLRDVYCRNNVELFRNKHIQKNTISSTLLMYVKGFKGTVINSTYFPF